MRAPPQCECMQTYPEGLMGCICVLWVNGGAGCDFYCNRRTDAASVRAGRPAAVCRVGARAGAALSTLAMPIEQSAPPSEPRSWIESHIGIPTRICVASRARWPRRIAVIPTVAGE